MTIRRFIVPVTTDDAGYGEGLAYSPILSGKLVSIRYVKDDFADGVDFNITSENTGETLWAESNVNASATRHPRAATQTTAGAVADYDASNHGVLAKIMLSQDRVKIAIDEGGDEKSGVFHITVDS